MEHKIMRRTRHGRSYLGTIVTASNYREILSAEGKDKIEFHKKHLKAYIQGKSTFYHGFTIPADITEKAKPIMHFVDQEYTAVERVKRIVDFEK